MKKTHKWAGIDGTPCNPNAMEAKCIACGLIRMRDGISTIYINGKRFWTKAPQCKGK